ncbi:MAG TPA: hypothetical protein VIM56_11290 [Rhizomicrobium sp.]
MRKRLNSTGRKKIPHELLTLRFEKAANDDPGRFTAELSRLSELGLDTDAKVYIEPYLGNSSMRFPFGTVGTLQHPADTTLDDLDSGEGIKFRIKIVDESGDVGRVLAMADQVEPHDPSLEPDDEECILPLLLRDIGERVWKVETEEGRPALILNRRIPNIRETLLSSPHMQGMIFPPALEEILDFALQEDAEEHDWAKDWRSFSEALLAEEMPEEMEESQREEIVSRVVEAFVNDQKYVSKIQQREENANVDA